MIPHIYNRSYTITADLEIPKAGAEGVIVAEADIMGGFSLYVQDGKLHYTYSMMGVRVDTLTSSEKVPTGKVQVHVRVHRRPAGQTGHRRHGATVHQRQAGRREQDGPTPCRSASPVTPAWTSARTTATSFRETYKAKAPFAFTGKIGKVVFDLQPQGVGMDERRRELLIRLAQAIRN